MSAAPSNWEKRVKKVLSWVAMAILVAGCKSCETTIFNGSYQVVIDKDEASQPLWSCGRITVTPTGETRTIVLDDVRASTQQKNEVGVDQKVSIRFGREVFVGVKEARFMEWKEGSACQLPQAR